MELRDYIDRRGRSPFRKWIDELDGVTGARIVGALERLRDGNWSNVKAIGGGVSELKMNFGPGYRVYFGREGASLVIILGGGSKQRQQEDIADAQTRWAEYKSRK